MALRLIRGFRTISDDAAHALLGITPIDLGIKGKYLASEGYTQLEIREWLRGVWQTRWPESQRGRWTYKLTEWADCEHTFPNVAKPTLTPTSHPAHTSNRWLGGSKEYCAIIALDVKNAFNTARWANILGAMRNGHSRLYTRRNWQLLQGPCVMVRNRSWSKKPPSLRRCSPRVGTLTDLVEHYV